MEAFLVVNCHSTALWRSVTCALHRAGIAVVLERTGFPSDDIVEVRTQSIVAFLGRVSLARSTTGGGELAGMLVPMATLNGSFWFLKDHRVVKLRISRNAIPAKSCSRSRSGPSRVRGRVSSKHKVPMQLPSSSING